MNKPVTLRDIEYICRDMLGVDWRPYLSNREGALNVLSRCQSKLEIMCLLGIGYYLLDQAKKFNPYHAFRNYPVFTTGTFKGQQGISINSVYLGCENDWDGPFSIFILPQFPSP